ncbi:MAG TPA: succinate dehydrogenase, cytochrome b556 subunit [Gallionellaceae bacterium]|nr:succinate dehydrogenase, cytochrome b556 subunit [Gallionellaceae bacterium]
MHNSRPKFLDLLLIQLPLPGVISILHRISGAVLFLALPFALWMLQYSLRSIETYTALVRLLGHPLSKAVLLVVLWALAHHFCAGLRFLAIDLGAGVKLRRARTSAKWVLVVSFVLTAAAGAMLW